MKYQVGFKIGNYTVESISTDPIKKGQYTLKCDCGERVKGPSAHITNAIKSLTKLGFSGCQKCRYDFIRERKMNSSEKYETIYFRYKKSAKNRGIEFTLTLDQAADAFKSNCIYCNKAPLNNCIRTKLMTYSYTGIDRIDNEKGYIEGNIVPCCQFCNVAKYTQSVTDFMEHIERIYLNNVQRLSRKGVESSDSKWEVSLLTQINKENDIV